MFMALALKYCINYIQNVRKSSNLIMIKIFECFIREKKKEGNIVIYITHLYIKIHYIRKTVD